MIGEICSLQNWTLEEWAAKDDQVQRWWRFWYRKQRERMNSQQKQQWGEFR